MKVYVGGGRAELVCPRAGEEGEHGSAQFVWQDGSEHAEYHALELACACGERLVHVAGNDPWQHSVREVEGKPHGA